MRRTKLITVLLFAALVFAPDLTVVHAKPQANGDEIVYVTKQGKKYHLENCRTIEGKTKFTMKLKDAVDGGYEPCKVCHPPCWQKKINDANTMTRSDQTKAFKLIDKYCRTHYKCFVAEFDIVRSDFCFRTCFRPTGGSIDSPHRYVCRYLQIPVDEAQLAVKLNALPSPLIEMLDQELHALGNLL